MNDWIVDWWKLLAVALFFAAVGGLWWLAKWSDGALGWWAPIAGGFIFIVAAWVIDRHSKPDSE